MPEKIKGSSKSLLFKKGEFLLKQGESSWNIYIIRKGSVRVFKTEEGVDIDLDISGPGNVVGEVAALDEGLRSASVVAVEDTIVAEISAEEFRRIVKKLPDWFQKIAKILVQRLRDADDRIDLSSGGEKGPRVAALVSLMTYTGQCEIQEDKYVFKRVPLENEIADMLNIRLSDASETLEALHKKEMVRLDKNSVVVSDRGKLDAFGENVYLRREETPAV